MNAKKVSAIEALKVTEDFKQLNETTSNFYPEKEGSDEAAYEACKREATNNDIYWDPKLKCFYYYIPRYTPGK